MGLLDAIGKSADTVVGGLMQYGGMAIGYRQGKKLMAKQHEYDLEKMEKQHGYNIESQQLGQQYNKDLWDYTNYENQKRHLEEAGLNPLNLSLKNLITDFASFFCSGVVSVLLSPF